MLSSWAKLCKAAQKCSASLGIKEFTVSWCGEQRSLRVAYFSIQYKCINNWCIWSVVLWKKNDWQERYESRVHKIRSLKAEPLPMLHQRLPKQPVTTCAEVGYNAQQTEESNWPKRALPLTALGVLPHRQSRDSGFKGGFLQRTVVDILISMTLSPVRWWNAFYLLLTL